MRAAVLLLRTMLAMLLGAAIALAPLARAEPSKAAKKEAFRLFGESEKRYREGKFEEAAALLRRAYELDPAPTLLFNLARALESAGDLAGAVDGYRKYLAADPKARDRGAIEKRLATLEAQLAERAELARIKEADPAPSPPDPPRAVEREHNAVTTSPLAERSIHPAPLVLSGVGAAGLLAGGILGIMAGGKRGAAEDEPDFQAAQRLDDDAKELATGANVAYATGGAVLTAGIVWLVLELSAEN